MKNTLKILCALTLFVLTFLFVHTNKVNSLTKIISNVEIVEVSGLKLIKDAANSNYKLVEKPENINIINAKIVHRGNIFTFTEKDNILIDKDGNFVENLEEDKYTLVLNTKELGLIYKIINKVDYGFEVLDIKILYDKFKNSLNISNANVLLADSEVTLFKEGKVGSTILNSEGKGSIYIKDIENLTTATYTIIVKKGSEILGVDAFHITPTYKELNLEGNVQFNITSEISNVVDVSLKAESGITKDDKVEIVSVYDLENPRENLLLNAEGKKNRILDLNGEVLLRDKLSKGKSYKAKLKINGIELESKDDCEINIKTIDTSKIKIKTTEKIGKDLIIDLSAVGNLNKDDIIEILSLHDVKNKEKNLIEPSKLTNKVNEIKLIDSLDASNTYEVVLQINNFPMDKFGVSVSAIDFSKTIAVTDIISKKIFISFENTSGLKITDNIQVNGVFKEGNETNLLKSEYNTKINNLNGTVFINQTLDTKNNYYISLKINNRDLEEKLKVTVNNDINLSGALIEGKNLSEELKVSFKNIDSISENDLIEIYNVVNLKDLEFNILNKEKNGKIIGKEGIVYLKTPILSNNEYGVKIKINGVKFEKLIPVKIVENENKRENDNKEESIFEKSTEDIEYKDDLMIKPVEGYVTEDNKLILNMKEFNMLTTDKVELNSITNRKIYKEMLSSPVENVSVNEKGELEIPLNITLEEDTSYLISISFLRENLFTIYNLEYNNKLNNINEVKEEENKINLDSIELGDCSFKFEHNLDKNMKFDRSYCDIAPIESMVDEKYIEVNKLVPYKKYKDLKITVKNSEGKTLDFYIPEFTCKESEDSIKNFISKTYFNLKNGLNIEGDSLKFADEVEFWSWFEKINKKEVTLRNFVFEALNETDFFKKYPCNDEKIKIIYRVIFGINPGEQSLKVWTSDLNKVLKTNDAQKAFKIVIEKMFTNLHFKSLEKQLK